ncbi:MAG: ABC transporter permease, partial [Planctomycetales bacterium]|nr:ABC transporter permease [Planctomycetales bacterium]
DVAGQPIEHLEDHEIVLNDWTANDLQAAPGDTIRLSYFAPETTHGEAKETAAEFRLRAIVPLTPASQPYSRNRPAQFAAPRSRATDPDLTPTVPGITDQQSIDDWDPPFPFDYRRIRKPRDEDYWDEHRTTPKAFISKAAGDRLWASRFGRTTSWRISWREDRERNQLEARLAAAIQNEPAAFGFRLLHLKADGLRAAHGTTPFNLLFLGFGSFVAIAALMLVSLLFRLRLEQRSSETGLLLAVGLPRPRITRMYLNEGSWLILAGAILGAVTGIGYAALMIAGLRTWWVGAVTTPFLQLYVTPLSLLIGALVSIGTSLLTIRFTIAGLRNMSASELLARQVQAGNQPARFSERTVQRTIVAMWLISIASGLSAAFLSGEAQAGAFFSCGGAALIAMLLLVARGLKYRSRQRIAAPDAFSLVDLARLNVSRNATRSTLTIGLMAAASFLIVAISAFRLAPTTAGTGGFALLGQTDRPVFDSFQDAEVRSQLFGNDADELSTVQILPLRLQAGDDASCRNLYQASQPQVLGVTPTFVAHFDAADATSFAWAGKAAADEQSAHNPWRLLQTTFDDPTLIPVVLDKNTAMYSLHLYRGVGEEFELDYDAAGTIKFKVVGLLANSVLQGSLLVSEQNLLAKFPDNSGYQFFCVDSPTEAVATVRTALVNRYADEGWESIDPFQRLADLMAVQNTYLSTFQSLGGLGLLLGTFGLVSVQLRNVFERRQELALLRAAGFSPRRIQRLVMSEHFTLLLGGLAVGVMTALIAVLPQALTTEVRPPWLTLAGILSLILIVGAVSGWLAIRPALRDTIVRGLREE